MKRIFNSMLIFGILALGACGSGTSNQTGDGESITIAHALDTIVVKKNPQRVIVFDIGTMDTFSKLGLKILGAPKRNIPEYLPQYKNDESIVDVGTVKEANYEKISELNPDLIIISGRLQSSYSELSKIAPTLYTQLDYKNYRPTFKENVEVIGKIFGKETEVAEELKRLDDKILRAKTKIEQDEGKGLIVLFNNGRFSSYGSGSRFGFLHDVLGVKTAIEEIEATTHGQVISSELIENTNPDYLFIVDRGAVVNNKGASKDEIENELIRQTKASKNGKVVYLDPQIWYLSGGGLISVDIMVDEISNVFK